jgi:hypothetical protein
MAWPYGQIKKNPENCCHEIYQYSDIPAKSVKISVNIISYKYMNSTKIIKDAASHAHFLALSGARFH